MVDFFSDGVTFLGVEALVLLPNFFGFWVHAKVVLDYVRIYFGPVHVALGKHILMFCEELLHGLSHVKCHYVANSGCGLKVTLVQGRQLEWFILI